MKPTFVVALILNFGIAGFAVAQTPAPATTKRPAAANMRKPAVPRPNPGLLNPSLMKAKAPDLYKVKFVTGKGDIVIEVHRDWAPNGADRFYNLVKAGYMDGAAFFRVISGFMAQFGINPSPAVNKAWRNANIQDDAVKQTNKRGYVTFAAASIPNSRGTQLFINLIDNPRLDSSGFAPIGMVVEGMDAVDKLYSGYGEGAPNGAGPDQGRVQEEGKGYLEKDFPQLDVIKSATIISPMPAPAPARRTTTTRTTHGTVKKAATATSTSK